MADTRTIASAVSVYSAHMGKLPDSLDDLTKTAVNARGDVGGPFMLTVPRPPGGSPAYRYEVDGATAFRIVGESHGEVVTAGSVTRCEVESPARPSGLRAHLVLVIR
jgi:hypothetical protein